MVAGFKSDTMRARTLSKHGARSGRRFPKTNLPDERTAKRHLGPKRHSSERWQRGADQVFGSLPKFRRSGQRDNFDCRFLIEERGSAVLPQPNLLRHDYSLLYA